MTEATTDKASLVADGVIEVLIVEDNPLITALYAKVLRREPDLHISDFVTNAPEAHAKLATAPVDVVLMDYKLPDGDGITAAARIRSEHPRTHVVILSGVTDDQLVEDALRAGCSGCLPKTEGVARLPDAVRAAHAGSTVTVGSSP